MNIDMDQIKKLLEVMDDNNLAEISLKNGEETLSLRKHEAQAVSSPMVVAPSVVSSKDDASSSTENSHKVQKKGKEITSPMVGTFYRSSSPDADAFVNVGDTISVGSVLCILEAMKLMNEFKSEVSGKIIDILVQNGEAVEFGQPLFLVEE